MEFIVTGKIIGKGRPRTNFKTGVIYTPKTTKDYEKLISKQIGDIKVDGAIAIDLECHFIMPKNLSKKKKAELINKPCLKKPDIDNITKIYLDSMNKKVYADDKQVYKIACSKQWDTEEYVKIKITHDII